MEAPEASRIKEMKPRAGLLLPWLSRERRSRGQSMLEMALLAPIIMLMLAGVIYFGSALNAQQIITNAAREGARAGTQGTGTEGSIQALVVDICRDAGLNQQQLGVQVTLGSPSTPSTVTVTYQFRSPFDGFFGRPSGITLSAQCVMKY